MHIIKMLVNIIFELGLFINAALFIPQIFRIIREKSSKGVSLITFLGFNLIQIVIIAHGLITGDWLLVIGIASTFIACGFVTSLIIFYKIKGQSK